MRSGYTDVHGPRSLNDQQEEDTLRRCGVKSEVRSFGCMRDVSRRVDHVRDRTVESLSVRSETVAELMDTI